MSLEPDYSVLFSLLKERVQKRLVPEIWVLTRNIRVPMDNNDFITTFYNASLLYCFLKEGQELPLTKHVALTSYSTMFKEYEYIKNRQDLFSSDYIVDLVCFILGVFGYLLTTNIDIIKEFKDVHSLTS